MQDSSPVLTTTIYHPKPGSEATFVKLWLSRVGTFAYIMGADHVGIYHNEETDEYLASAHWPSKQHAQKFLNSKEFQDAMLELNVYSLIPSTKNHFEILHERAA